MELNKKNFSGSRKTAVASIRDMGLGNEVIVNKKSLKSYFQDERLVENAIKAFSVLGVTRSLDIKVCGSGTSAQSSAIRYAIAKLFAESSDEYRAALRKSGILSGDPRRVERKIPGHYGSRAKYPFKRR